jgi:hypothetical protein
MGRPSLYTAEVVEAICERLSEGEPLAQICRDEGMPAARTVRDWIAERPDVAAAIARAREDGEDRIAADCLAIADDGRRDYVTLGGDDDSPKVAVDHDHIQRSKLRIETRLKLLAKWNPKKWGDRQAVEHSGAVGHLTHEQWVDSLK